MSLWKIAWRSIQQRGVASCLTTLSMALGVMLVVIVLSVHGAVSESFRGNSSLGYNMVVGARGGKLQLTLNTVYYLSQPVETIPYDYYLEFLTSDRRGPELENSIANHAHQAHWQTSQLQASSLLMPPLGGPHGLGARLAVGALEEVNEEPLDKDRDGRFGLFTVHAIPLCLGDYYGGFRVIGTTPELFDDLVYDVDADKKYDFAEGRNFERYNDEHGYFEAVVGSAVARKMRIRLGDEIAPSHGVQGGTHEQKFTVVGILAQSLTPNDRAVFVNLEGFLLMDDHAKIIESEDEDSEQEPEDEDAGGQPGDPLAHRDLPGGHDHQGPRPEPLPIEQREISAMLIRTTGDIEGMMIMNLINEGALEDSVNWSEFRPSTLQKSAQAVQPIREIHQFFQDFVGPIRWVLLLLTAMICVVSGISILVSIYNSMSERRREIAVIRALGAGRTTVMTIILLESIMLSLAGGLLGWIGGHAVNAIANPYVEQQTGVSVGFFSFAPSVNVLELVSDRFPLVVSPELLLIPALIVLAIIVGFIPALAAYRTDVAKSLGA